MKQYVVVVHEYELGWGQRLINKKVFDSLSLAKDYASDINDDTYSYGWYLRAEVLKPVIRYERIDT